MDSVAAREFGLRIAKDQVALVAALRNAELVIVPVGRDGAGPCGAHA